MTLARELRRRAAARLLTAGAVLALAATGLAPGGAPQADAAVSPIRHVVLIYQENHSFDNLFGFLCVQDDRCDGQTWGKTHDGKTIQFSRGQDIVPQVKHLVQDQVNAINGGSMDGWDLVRGCEPGTGYRCYQGYRPEQIPSLSALARRFVISDRTFQLHSVPSFPAHVEVVAAKLNGFAGDNPDFVEGNPHRGGWGCDSYKDVQWRARPAKPFQLVPACVPKPDGTGPYRPSPVKFTPTIMDRMEGAGLSWKIYGPQLGGLDAGYPWSICPYFAKCIFGPQRSNFVPPDDFLDDARAGSLPNLSILTPPGAVSQHNGDSMLAGDNYIASRVNAVMNGPDWDSSAIFIFYDDCGCFVDHVPPPPGLSLRVPMVIVSPYAKPGFTDSQTATLVSPLAFTEHTFGLAPLSKNDREAYDYAGSFDYTQTPIEPMRLEKHPVPRWVRKWLRAHPIVLSRGEDASSLRRGRIPDGRVPPPVNKSGREGDPGVTRMP